MPSFNIKGISSYTKAESLVDETNLELAKQQRSYMRNSDRSFTWGQVAKYSGMIFGAVVGGLSFAISSALFNPVPAGAELTAMQSLIQAAGPEMLALAVGASAVVSIAATYIAYRIGASNHVNAAEINASSIADKIRERPLEVSVAPTVSEPTVQQQPHNHSHRHTAAATYPPLENAGVFNEAATQISTADAELISRISHDLEPLSTNR